MALTLSEVDEALSHARAVPEAERGPGWSAYVDSLLDKRRALELPAREVRETRVLFSSEHR